MSDNGNGEEDDITDAGINVCDNDRTVSSQCGYSNLNISLNFENTMTHIWHRLDSGFMVADQVGLCLSIFNRAALGPKLWEQMVKYSHEVETSPWAVSEDLKEREDRAGKAHLQKYEHG